MNAKLFLISFFLIFFPLKDSKLKYKKRISGKMMEYNKELNNSGYSKDLLLYPTHLRDACRVRCAMLDGL